jgi:hypothetical protein
MAALRTIIAALLLTLLAGPATSRAPARVRLDYAGFLVDAEVLYAQVDVSLGDGIGPYRMNLSSGLVGTLGQLYPFHLLASSQGRVAGLGPLPLRYSSEFTLFETRQTMTLTYGAHGAVRLSDDPPTEEGQVAKARGLLAGTIDPLSAALAVAHEVARVGRCEGTLHVFDGARRYDLSLHPAPDGLPVPRLAVPVEGTPIACDATLTLISGFPQDAVESGMYPKTARFWLAPNVAGPLPALLRLEADSGLGHIHLDLRDVLPQS